MIQGWTDVNRASYESYLFKTLRETLILTIVVLIKQEILHGVLYSKADVISIPSCHHLKNLYSKECLLLGYKTPVCTSQETYYVSATQSSRLMLCNIWRSHSSDHEECCFLWYKNPVLTSQETLYFSVTECSRLMICKIWGVHGGDY
jgi:hypothetical protein